MACATPTRRRAVAGAGPLVLALLLGCASLPGPAGPREGRTDGGLWFDVRGQGPDVVLVHGAFLDSRQWQPQLALARDLRLIRYDTRWHGRSAGAERPFAAADDLREVMDAAGASAATVVGLSNGARIAVDFALAHPGRVTALVLVSPDVDGFRPADRPAFWTPLSAALGRRDYLAAATVLAESPIMTVSARDTAWVRAMVRDHARVFAGQAALERRGAPPAIQRLDELRMPVLIIVGGADLPDIQRAGQLLAERVPGARLTRVPDAHHLLSISHATAFNQALTTFVRGMPQR